MLQWLAYLLPNPTAKWSMPRVTETFSEEIIDNVSEALLGGKWTWLENVNRTQLVLASDKVVIQKHNKHLCIIQV